jgi:hypothetical protein
MYFSGANKNTSFPDFDNGEELLKSKNMLMMSGKLLLYNKLSRISDVFALKIKCLYIVRKLRLSCFKTALCILNPLIFLFNLLNYLNYVNTV